MYLWMILLILLSAVFCMYQYFHRKSHFFKEKGIPFLEPIPIFGNMAEIVFRLKALPYKIQDSYNSHPDAKYVGFYDSTTPIIMLRDPELVRSIAVTNFDSFPNHRTFTETPTESLFEKSLFALQDKAWREMRALLSPAFTSGTMKLMFKQMSQCAMRFTDCLTKLDPRPQALDMKDSFGRYTLDVVASSEFGLSLDSMKERNNDFYIFGKKIADFSISLIPKLCMFRICPKFAKTIGVTLLDAEGCDFFTNKIRSVIAMRRAENTVRSDMIDLMLQAREKQELTSDLSIEDITAQMLLFLVGGFDSSTTTMCYSAHELALNPDMQRKLQAEIDDVLERGSGQVSYEDLHAMKYLDAVVSETLRKYPPATFTDRVGVKSFTLPPALPGLEPLRIEPGQIIWIPCHCILNDPKNFPYPEKFDPERFNEENKIKINPLSYIPFGVGPRVCLAKRFAMMEIKLVLFHLLAKCNVLPTAKTRSPIKFSAKSITGMPEGGFWLKVEPRDRG